MDVIAIEFDMHARKFRDVEIILLSGYVVMGEVRRWDISCLAGYSGPSHSPQAISSHSLNLG